MSEELGFIHRYVRGDSDFTLLLLHGTGGNEDDLLGVGRAIAPQPNLLSPRGKSLDEGIARFFRRFGEGKFDEQDVIFRANELADFIAAAADEYQFDARRVIALGYSNGANIAAAVMLLRPDAIGGALLLRAMVPLEPNPLPNLRKRPVLMLEGRHDPIVPAENAQRLEQIFKDANALAALMWIDAGHGLTSDDMAACEKWISQITSSGEPPRAG
jgi:phospholipase/carboxylesterase